jgi:hypothetical protein
MTALASSVNKRKAGWKAVFTQEQINGWLAVDMVRNHPDLLPPAMRDPRVVIHPGQMMVACRYRGDVIETVLSLTLDAYLLKENKIAIRCRKARAGAVPLPLGTVLGQISAAAKNLKWNIEWQQADGDPVAVVTIPAEADEGDKAVVLETLRLAEGEIQIAGNTHKE